MVRTDSFALVLSLLGGIVLLLIIAPLAGMFFSTPLADIFSTARESEVQSSIWLTLSTSFFATLFFAFFAIPLAYVLARKNFPGKRMINGIIDLPIVIPHSAAGIAVLGFVSRDTALGKLASALGFDFVGSPAGIAKTNVVFNG